MAQAQPEEKIQGGSLEKNMKETNGVSFKFNAQAPEFVPRSHTQLPVSGYFYPCFNFLGGTGTGSDWLYVGDQETAYLISNPNVTSPDRFRTILTDDLKEKIIKQVIDSDNFLPFLAVLYYFLPSFIRSFGPGVGGCSRSVPCANVQR